jgi:hypothetical protein
MWIEVVAYDVHEAVVFESGRVADTEPIDEAGTDPAYDPQLALCRDWIYDANGDATHDFWKVVVQRAPRRLRKPDTSVHDRSRASHTRSASFAIARDREFAHMTIRLRMRPIDIDVLPDLVDTADLDAELIARVPTFTL